MGALATWSQMSSVVLLSSDQGEEEIEPEGGVSFTYSQVQRGDLQKAPLAWPALLPGTPSSSVSRGRLAAVTGPQSQWPNMIHPRAGQQETLPHAVSQGPRLLLSGGPWSSALDHLCPTGWWRRRRYGGGEGVENHVGGFLGLCHFPPRSTGHMEHQGRLGNMVVSTTNRLNCILPQKISWSPNS